MVCRDGSIRKSTSTPHGPQPGFDYDKISLDQSAYVGRGRIAEAPDFSRHAILFFKSNIGFLKLETGFATKIWHHSQKR